MTDEELKALFEEDARAMAFEARVPAPGQVWWRAAMRARAEAARAAARPLAWSQGLAAACAVGLAAAAAGAVWPMLGDVSALETSRWLLPLAIIVATGLALLPLALYVVFSDD